MRGLNVTVEAMVPPKHPAERHWRLDRLQQHLIDVLVGPPMHTAERHWRHPVRVLGVVVELHACRLSTQRKGIGDGNAIEKRGESIREFRLGTQAKGIGDRSLRRVQWAINAAGQMASPPKGIGDL